MKRYIRSSINGMIPASVWDVVADYFVDNDLPQHFSIENFPEYVNKNRFREFENESYRDADERRRAGDRLILKFLESRGIDSDSKVKALAYLINSQVDILPILEQGWEGTVSELRQIGKSKRNQEDEETRRKLYEEYSEYWDESQGAFVFKIGSSSIKNYRDSQRYAYWMRDYIKRKFNKVPAVDVIYNTADKCWKVYVHWD